MRSKTLACCEHGTTIAAGSHPSREGGIMKLIHTLRFASARQLLVALLLLGGSQS